MAIKYLTEPPAQCGERLLPVVIDEVARDDPDRTFISVPRSSTAAEGYVDISFKKFAAAVNRGAWWLEDHVGKSQQSAPVFFLGPTDIMYLVILYAAAKTGHLAFFSSHRNSLKAHLSLLESIGCDIVLEPEDAPPMLAQILAERHMNRVPMPSLDFFLRGSSGEEVKDYPFEGTFNEFKNETFAILHTSGSTGIPKPVFVPHGVFASQDAQQLIPFLGGKPTWVDIMRGNRVFIGLPLFHAACLAKVAYSVFAGATVVLPPAGPLSAEVVDAVFTHGNLDGALIAPSLIVDVYKNKEFLSNMLQRIKFLAYVGGRVSKAIGDDIASKIQLITTFGATETLSHPVELHDESEDWEYISYSSFCGHEYRPVGDGLYEMVLVRNPDLTLFQGVFSTFPKLNEYDTNDLYEAHPTKTGMWRFRMRSDDIICFNNAEKLNPITMEAIITGHPQVQSAVIGGHGQFQACLLLEPKLYPSTPEEVIRFVDDVWPTVIVANKDCPAHGRVMKDFIMLTDPARPLPRAGKDTVLRSAAFKLYEHEFQAIYDELSKPEPTTISPIPISTNTASEAKPLDRSLDRSLDAPDFIAEKGGQQSDVTIEKIDTHIRQYLDHRLPEMIAEQLNQSLGNIMSQMAASLLQQPKPTLAVDRINSRGNSPLKDLFRQVLLDNSYLSGLTDDANLFGCGLDSLQVPVLIKHFNNALGGMSVKSVPITAKQLYDNPSVNTLAQSLGES